MGVTIALVDGLPEKAAVKWSTKAIEVCGKIADSDYRYVQPVLEQTELLLQALLENVQNTVKNMKVNEDKELDVKGSREALVQAIQYKIQPLIALQKLSLRRNAPCIPLQSPSSVRPRLGRVP